MKLKQLIIYILSLCLVMSLVAAVSAFAAESEEKETYDYLGKPFPSAKAKLNTMELYFENDEYALYGLEETGEVGILVKSTEQILLTNPYDAASSLSSNAVKEQLLSQILLTYSDSAGNVVSMNSFADAAFASDETKQIKMSATRTGIRTEYTIGRENVKYIVPKQIEKTAFEEEILSKFDKDSREYRKLTAYYSLKDINAENQTQASIDSIITKWPITKKYAIYVLDAGIYAREMLELEGYIKNNTYYDDYSKVEEMYEMLDYVDISAAPALFRFAIEYSVDDLGLQIKLPANSIRYDSSTYTLQSVNFLPYFGAGNNNNKGFTLVTDGSGTITRFEDIAKKSFTLTGKLYGKDYSFHSISGTTQEVMRIPAYGVMQTTKSSTGEEKSSGYVAYISEGDAMCEISASHGGTVHGYSSAYTTFYPKPTDSYVLEGISTTGNAVWTVYSDRRYTGNYTLRIFPITGADCDYNDMASVIREYLVAEGVFEKMNKENDKSEDVPLYLETFGTVETTQKIIGFPVNVQTPLTTFEQTEEMLAELKENGIDNINVKLTGWYNGGLQHTAPTKIKVENKIGGVKGLKSLNEYALANGVEIYPDLDFVHVDTFSMFDGFDYKDDSIKTIDGRSAAYRKYSPLYQGFEKKGSLIISPTSMTKFYADIRDDYDKLESAGISVASLGSELSSDHNSDYALNREDVKLMIESLLGKISEDNGKVMVSGGNAYVLPYADHILGVPLDSSLNINTSESIPFVGMVLHGNVEFTGSAINLDGDYDYSVLKAIENGANLYYILSKENTSELKQFEQFSKYYAIGYDIWKDDLISTYEGFNDVMKKVKYSYLTEHETLADRVVKVVYENGVSFVLNYNTNEIKLDGGITVEPMSYIELSELGINPDDVALSGREIG